MQTNYLKKLMKNTVHVATVLLLGAGFATAQQQINLSVGPTSASLPGGTTVPMWGYSCGVAVGGSTASCAAANPAAGAGWSPVIIKAATGSTLQINLTNNLSFANGNKVPTSIMIVGQLGGGLGNVGQRTTTPSPTHSTQTDATWSTVTTAASPFQPPTQGARVQSFGTEVAAGTMTSLTWSNLRPGTYLLESGTHPSIQVPMGLYGVLVVTQAPTAAAGLETNPGIAYPNVTYDAEVPMVLGEIDPVQNNAVSTAVNTAGFLETNVWSGQPGGCGNPASSTYLTCYPPAVNYTPLYYLINGVGFSRTSAASSLFPTVPASTIGGAGTILVRLVNAGSRMHVPSIVNSQVTVANSAGAVPATKTVGGMGLIAEDGNPAPGLTHVQNEVFMAAGKTFDVMVNAPVAGSTALAVYDRELSLSANKINRDAGMLAYVGVNGSAVPSAAGDKAASTKPDFYYSLIPGMTFTVSDPAKGVIANDINVYAVTVYRQPSHGTVTLNPDGTFAYVPNGTLTTDQFNYCANGTVTGTSCSSGLIETAYLKPATLETSTNISFSVNSLSYTSKVATYIKVPSPGILMGATDAAGYPLTVSTSTVVGSNFATLVPDAQGGFTATVAPHSGTAIATFTFQAQNAQGVLSNQASVTVNFPAPNGPTVTVTDPKSGEVITDYRWIIEEDRSMFNDPGCTTNPPPATSTVTGYPCLKTGTNGTVPELGVNFHTSDMPYVAQGCTGEVSCESGQTMIDPSTGNHVPAVCDKGNGACRPDTSSNGKAAILPSQVSLDSTKRYYISVLPGDAANPFTTGYGGSTCSVGLSSNTSVPSFSCGHSMGGAPVTFPAGASATSSPNPVTVLVEQDPFPPAKLTVNVYEDDFPLNGEQDSGGGVDILATNEPSIGDFNIVLWDDMGGNGDVTGQMTYDMFNQPLSNSLDGTIDPVTGANACPITQQGTTSPTGITGMITVCPQFESDKTTLSPLAGQAVIANLMPGRFSVQAIPGADRIARGENWLQTNTLDGQKAHDSFLRIGEPAYFQEFGPANYHVSIGFANPAIINARKAGVCNGSDVNITGTNCNNTITGKVTTERMSRTPDERLYSSGSHDAFAWTQCYVSFGDPDGEDFAFTYCNPDGTFTLSGLPDGTWRVTVFDEWNDMLVDGLSTPVALAQGSTGGTTNMGDIATNQWQSNIYTRTFVDKTATGVSNSDDPGIPLINTTVRYRDGSLANNLVTDFNGTANFNETFPLFNWYVVEADTTRYKNTGTHTVYDAGGPADGSASCGQAGYPACGTSVIGKFMANTYENNPVPALLAVPGSVYCPVADCTSQSILNVPASRTGTLPNSTGRIDNPWYGGVEGWQGFSGQSNFVEFGKEPYVAGENGGIKGHVIYASTRPFDDPQQLVQTQWEPLVPHVTINLYKEGFATDGVTPTLTLVDTTMTSSWDDFAQGFHLGPDGKTMVPDMNCPGQTTADLFYFSIYNQPQYLDLYTNVEHGTATAPTPMPSNAQFKCYDGMHNWNQLQPAVYDGMYQFPSVTTRDPITGKPTATNCTICQNKGTANAAPTLPATDLYFGVPQLPTGKYVVEVVPPSGYEIVKEEDKNILIGDNFIAPVSQEFGGLGDIFIIPDQASVSSAQQYGGPGYNQYNAQNPTQALGAGQSNGIVPGFTPEPTWPCVGESRIVPDYISLFPQSKQVAPFAGATRNLCDRKEVTLNDQAGAIAKFYIYTSVHKASKFTGVITDDTTSEFDPFSPQFGEKFAPANMPIALRDWTGAEIGRVYSDWWGDYNGMVYSTWEVNPPNPTGYSPNMMIFCMNDKGPIPSGTGTVTDPLYNSQYSQFCYELPYMPGQTDYLDTPVVPTAAFSAGYNHPDCSYPDATPAIARVDGNGSQGGPWVSAPGAPITITALGDQSVNNYGYAGPQATSAPFNQKTISRHYGFGTAPTDFLKFPKLKSPATYSCSGGGATAQCPYVTVGGQSLTNVTWGDLSITGAVPSTVPACAMQQQAQYGGSNASCGQLVITAANGKQSVDAINITIGGKAPTYVTGNAPLTPNGTGSIQQAIDAAKPGDLILVPPGTYSEMLLMWKPVRLQGFAAASTTIDANAQPAGKMDPWRREVNCLFGLALNGTPSTGNVTVTSGQVVPGTGGSNPYDPSGSYSCGTGFTDFVGTFNAPQIDRLPLEGMVGWDATVNGNLAQLLQEPTLMGAYEGAGITVLAKGVNVPSNSTSSYYGSGAEATFPTGTLNLTTNDCTTGPNGTNLYPSSFWCNPSRIDGLTVTDSSAGGGGIFTHAWTHNLEISNNRVFGNIGTLSGGINIGQGEFPDAYLNGTTLDTDPGSCLDGTGYPANTQMPYCFQNYVNVHNNLVTSNTSIGDELFSGTPAGAGGVSFCTGSDYYKFNYNWVCGNYSTGDGGGFAHLGFIWNGDVEHNSIIFNQSLNPTIPTNGGGVVVMGAAPDGAPVGSPVGTECGSVTDNDCAPGLSDGTGPGLVINANLIQGNAAEAGSGGGLRFQAVNGTDIPRWFNDTVGGVRNASKYWNSALVTNNIIVNNVAGWDGGGLSFEDALSIQVINNTIASNDSTATAGVLFNTIGAPLASSQTPGTTQTTGPTTSAPQPAGIVTMQNSPQMTTAFPAGQGKISCPSNQGGTSKTDCGVYSIPLLANDLIWQNRSFQVSVGGLSAAVQQNIVTLYNSAFTGAGNLGPALSQQSTTGQCPTNSSYWDLGFRGDTGPGKHSTKSGVLTWLKPSYSLLTSLSESGGSGTHEVTGQNAQLVSQYCNGSRTPPEFQKGTWNVPPGISDATVPNPIFNLSPAATVDEGNNWINMAWGPLSLLNPVTNATLANYAPSSSSPALHQIPASESVYTSNLSLLQYDFFGNVRPAANSNTTFDIGAVNSLYAAAPVFSLAGSPTVYHTQQTLILTDVTPGAVIYYTITPAGTTPVIPTNLSTQYTGAITINASETVEAIAYAPGYYPSTVSSKTYIYTPPAAAPAFSLPGTPNVYHAPTTLYLTDTTPGAVIYYTYTPNGATPSNTSTLYNPANGITINMAGYVEAIAYATNFYQSAVSNKQYLYVPVQAAAVTFSVPAGTLNVPTLLTLSDTTSGAVIHYTTNGTPATATSPTFPTAGITISATETVSAIAVAPGYLNSNVTSNAYTYSPLPKAATPSFSLAGIPTTYPIGSHQTLSLSDTTPGAVIYYTTNGSTPVPNAAGTTQYSGAITVSASESVKAIAVATGYSTSNVGSKTYTFQ